MNRVQVALIVFLTQVFSSLAFAGWGSSGGGGNGVICFNEDKNGAQIASQLLNNIKELNIDPTRSDSNSRELVIPSKYIGAIDTIELRELIEMKWQFQQNSLAESDFLNGHLSDAMARFVSEDDPKDILRALNQPDASLKNVEALLANINWAIDNLRSKFDPGLLPPDLRSQYGLIEGFVKVMMESIVPDINRRMQTAMRRNRTARLPELVSVPYVKDVKTSVLSLLPKSDRKRCIPFTLVMQDWRLDGNAGFTVVDAIYSHPKHSGLSRTLTLLHESVYNYLRKTVPAGVNVTNAAGDVRRIVHLVSSNELNLRELHQILSDYLPQSETRIALSL